MNINMTWIFIRWKKDYFERKKAFLLMEVHSSTHQKSVFWGLPHRHKNGVWKQDKNQRIQLRSYMADIILLGLIWGKKFLLSSLVRKRELEKNLFTYWKRSHLFTKTFPIVLFLFHIRNSEPSSRTERKLLPPLGYEELI